MHCRTALAEAEVEYEPHTSPSIYVEFPLATKSADELARACARAGRPDASRCSSGRRRRGRSRRIWRVAFHPDFEYGAYPVDAAGRQASDETVVIVAKDLADAVAAKTGRTFGEPLATFDGRAMERLVFRHPLYARDSLARARRLRHARGRHRRRAHGARARRGRLSHRRQVRPRDLRPARSRRPLPRDGRAVRAACRCSTPTRRSKRRSPSAAGCGIARTTTTRIRTAGAATTR